jgi:DNA-binding beta-propeller fold protein YncE
VASPDGKTFYFAAYDAQGAPGIFSTPSDDASTASEIAAGDPLSHPIGLVMSCDGNSLYIADLGGENGAILSLDAAGGAPTDMGASNVIGPSGLAMGPDCKTIYATGRTTDGQPALFTLSTAGGPANLVYQGSPLVSPTGVHVDTSGVAWVMDHLAAGMNGEGVLFAIPSDGSSATEVVSGMKMGTPGGVSLTAGGGTAVMPTRDANGLAQLTSVDIASGEMTQLSTPDMIGPSGVRTARGAGVMIVVDSEAGAIYRAQ